MTHIQWIKRIFYFFLKHIKIHTWRAGHIKWKHLNFICWQRQNKKTDQIENECFVFKRVAIVSNRDAANRCRIHVDLWTQEHKHQMSFTTAVHAITSVQSWTPHVRRDGSEGPPKHPSIKHRLTCGFKTNWSTDQYTCISDKSTDAQTSVRDRTRDARLLTSDACIDHCRKFNQSVLLKLFLMTLLDKQTLLNARVDKELTWSSSVWEETLWNGSMNQTHIKQQDGKRSSQTHLGLVSASVTWRM